MFHMSIIMAQYSTDGGRRVKAWPRATASDWLPCSLLQHSQVFWQPTSELKITAWAPHWLHLSSGCGLCTDEVLKGSLCKWILFWRRGAERTDKTPVRRARLSVVRSRDEQMPASWRHGSAGAQLISNWGFKFLLKFSISKLFAITTMGRWNTPINMAICWRCNQNNSWSEYKSHSR